MGRRAVQFSIDLDRALDRAMANARLKFIDICLEAAQKVIERSPVDTGFYRSNWSVAINRSPEFRPLENPGKLSFLGAQPVMTMQADIMKAQLGDVVFIYNNTAYAARLENGHSGQAPHGVARITAEEIKAKYGGRR